MPTRHNTHQRVNDGPARHKGAAKQRASDGGAHAQHTVPEAQRGRGNPGVHQEQQPQTIHEALPSLKVHMRTRA